jgi:predicted lipoprotein with Yx(FWY)xxD motif
MFAIRAPWARHPGTVACLAALVALVVAGCGGGDDGSGGYGGGGSGSGGSGSSGADTVAVRSTALGDVLVGANGHTLYLFEKDKGPKSTCFGACARQWPPLTSSGKPKGGSGVTASLLATTPRRGGKAQVTYNGHPLYYFAQDSKTGDTKGQDLDAFGAEWYVLSPKGVKVERSGGGEDSGSGGAKPYSSY